MGVILAMIIIGGATVYMSYFRTSRLDRVVATRAKANKIIVNEFLTKAQPRDMGTELITQGDPTHKHSFQYTDWDYNRFGAGLIDIDPDPGTPIAFPMGTWKELFRCKCGAEKIRMTRALI